MSTLNKIHKIQRFIAIIDQLLQAQLNTILHHPRFQQLEASFRGLHYLTAEIPQNCQPAIKVKILNVSWQELSKDLSRAVEFDQSQLFSKVYSHEFGQAGGEPFGLLLGNYAISHRNRLGYNHMMTLRVLTKVAAAAFAPLMMAIEPSFLGLDTFTKLEPTLNLTRTFQQIEYRQWKSLRQDEDARFLGLLLPNVLLRLPWQEQKSIREPFSFQEEIRSHGHYLWGNPVWCFAAVTLHTFAQTGWFSAMRGADRVTAGGRVRNLPQAMFNTDLSFLAQKAPVEVYITDQQEKALSDQGFIALCRSKNLGQTLFYDCMSVQKPTKYEQTNANENSKLSCRLHYILCVCRFAHYLKIIARNELGAFASAEECQRILQNWIHQYVVASTDLSEALKIKYPLRNAQVTVFERLGQTGVYLCTIHISPHYQFDSIQTDLRFITELAYVS